jgi:hypothetical protein
MVNTIPDANQCHPLGRSVMRWQTGKEMPNSKNYGYLIWKKETVLCCNIHNAASVCQRRRITIL